MADAIPPYGLPLPAGIDREPFRTLAALADGHLRAIDAALPGLAVHRVADVDEGLLPHLGWRMHLFGEGWDLARSAGSRRALILDAIMLHRMKGTPAAVTRAIAALGFGGARVTEAPVELPRDGTVRRDRREVYGGPDRWATFKVGLPVGDVALDGATAGRLVAAVTQWKAARSHLSALAVGIDVATTRDTVPVAIPRVRAGLTIAVKEAPMRDGRFRRGGARRHARDGSVAYDGARQRAGVVVEGLAFGKPPVVLKPHVGLRSPVRRAGGPPRDGAIRYDGVRTRSEAGPMLRWGLQARYRVAVLDVGFRVAGDPLGLTVTHVGLGTATAPVADHLTDAVLVPVTPVPAGRALGVPWTIPADVAVGVAVGEVALVCADGTLAARIAFDAAVPKGADEWAATWTLIPAPSREAMA